MITTLDVETTVVGFDGKRNPSPYLEGNALVCVGYANEEEAACVWFNHKHREPTVDGFKIIQDVLDKTTLLVAHNMKFDLAWLRECGFVYNGAVHCTMIEEYLEAGGIRRSLKLKDILIRLNLPILKASELIEEEFHVNKIGFDEIDWEVVEEYNLVDVAATEGLYNYQNDPSNGYAGSNVSELCNEVCDVLVDVENAGIFVDVPALASIKQELLAEKAILEKELNETILQVMGDVPYKLTSTRDKMTILFSKSLRDRQAWQQVFNLGTHPNGIKKFPTRMKKTAYATTVRTLLQPIPKREMNQCPNCGGSGKVGKTKKNGEMSKAYLNCRQCSGKGIVYISTGKVAGFKLKTPPSQYVTVDGFSSDKDALLAYADTTDNLEAQVFMRKLARFSAVSTYLTNFVGNIERRTLPDGRIHPQFNQTVTRTGRLSSSKPNFQNMPRGGTFPVKRCIVSRFDGGLILEGDFAQLEFRVAGFLADDPKILEDVVAKVDVHTETATIIYGVFDGEGKHPRRQDAKGHTFKPLYGGTSGTEDEKRYYKAFLTKYEGVKGWQDGMMEEALTKKKLTLPSGRVLRFPNVKREAWGISNATTIKNWPVQSFATADLLPISLVHLHKGLKHLESMIINTVHDSIIVDVHPAEVEEVVAIFKEAMACLPEESERRFGVKYNMPVGFDVKLGSNWLELEEVYETNG